MTRLAPSALLLLSLLVVSRAGASSVEVRGDRGLDASKLESLVALELGKDASRVTRVAIEVRGRSAEIVLVMGEETRTATVAIAGTEPERAVALFVGELARGESASPSPSAGPSPSPSATPGASPSATPGASVSATPGPSPSSSPSASPRAAWELSVLGAVGVRAMTTRGAVLVTPQLEVGARIGGFRLGATARYGYTSADDPLGTARAHLVTGGLAVTDTFFTRGPFAIGTGPRLELGAIAGSGEGANGTSSSAFTIAGAWVLELRVKVGPLALLVAGEGGVSRGLVLQADDRDVLHVSGPFVGASAGVLF